MRVNQRRSDIEIMADMLRIVENGAGKTRIMYQADMSYNQMRRYLWFLTEQGFLFGVSADKTQTLYYATDKGNKLLESIDHLADILGLYSEDSYYVKVVS